MTTQFKNLIRNILSGGMIAQIYERRRLKMLGQNSRTAANVVLVAGILLGLMTFVGGMLFVERDTHAYLKSRNRVTLLEHLDGQWQIGEVLSCGNSAEECLPLALDAVPVLESQNLNEIRLKSYPSTATKLYRLKLEIPSKSWQSLSEYLTLVISLPNMKYTRAVVFLDGVMQRNFYLSRPINFPFETKNFQGRDLKVEVVLEAKPSEPFAVGNSQPAFISTQSEFEKFGEHVALQRSGKGNWIAVVSRITLTLFAIAMFLLVDSSPESLGLALFMGFEALGIAAKQGWMPLTWLGPWWDIFASALFTNLGVVFRLYFCLNLARVVGPSIKKWLVAGFTWATPMAFYAMWSANKPGGFYNEIQSAAVLLLAIFGMASCVAMYLYIRRDALRWRKLALLSAVFGSVPTVLLSLDSILPSFITEARILDALYGAQFNSGFLLALSAFFNISSLENRVKALSLVQVKAKQLELELELGRAVQKQHMKIPKLPDQIVVDYYQSAASYVSGDTFFFNWDAKRNVFTFLLNDVTGHGVQAALKATICNVMADILWVNGSGRPALEAQPLGSKISEYYQLLCKYFGERFQEDELHSVCGAEFYVDQGRLVLFRSNAPLPIIIQPKRKESEGATEFDVINLVLQNQDVTSIDLAPGAVVILMSDGILSSSRERAHVSRKLSEFVANAASRDLSLTEIKAVIMEATTVQSSDVVDDKTVIMFKWQPSLIKLKPIKTAV